MGGKGHVQTAFLLVVMVGPSAVCSPESSWALGVGWTPGGTWQFPGLQLCAQGVLLCRRAQSSKPQLERRGPGPQHIRTLLDKGSARWSPRLASAFSSHGWAPSPVLPVLWAQTGHSGTPCHGAFWNVRAQFPWSLCWGWGCGSSSVCTLATEDHSGNFLRAGSAPDLKPCSRVWLLGAQGPGDPSCISCCPVMCSWASPFVSRFALLWTEPWTP